MKRLNGTFLRRPRTLKPEFPIVRFAASSVPTGTPSESKTLGSIRHTRSGANGTTCRLEPSLPDTVTVDPAICMDCGAGVSVALEPELAHDVRNISNTGEAVRTAVS
jgi:hypothetical protein